MGVSCRDILLIPASMHREWEWGAVSGASPMELLGSRAAALLWERLLSNLA